MSIDILFELQHEVRRLFIAGSGMAAGDLRLTRMLPQLQKLGEAAPVFKRMAQAVNQVLEAEASESASRLLELGGLLSSVLYTQGKTETNEQLGSMDGTSSALTTAIPYRKLGPLKEALTQKGQGRMEQIRLAYDDGLFQDLRILPAAAAALDDSYAEIPEFLQTKVFPHYESEALPVLLRQLRLDGGKGDARRLELIHSLRPPQGLSILLSAAQDGSTEVRAAAIELLGDYPEQEDFVLEQADDKKKEIRRAALLALSKLGTKPAIDRLYRALDSKDRDLAIEPIQLCGANELTLSVIAHAEQALEAVVTGSNVKEAAQQLLADLHSLHGKRVPEVLALLQKLLSTPAFIVPETEAVQEAAASLLLELDMPEAYAYAITLHEMYASKFIAYSFKAAVKILSPEDVYERFRHELKDKKSASAKELLRVLHELTTPLYGADSWQSDSENEWDERWVHLLVQLDEEELVCRFVRGTDAKVAAYLIRKCEALPGFNRGRTAHMLLVLAAMRVPQAPELVMNILEKGGSKQLYYLDRTQLTLLSLLPRSCADRLKRFAETLSYVSVKNQLLEIAESLAEKPEQAKASEPEEKGQGLWGWIKSKMS